MDPLIVFAAAGGALASYLIGSVPFAFFAGKVLAGVDIRTVGSGNVGATNVARLFAGAKGVAVFLVVFVLDVGKGVAAGGLAAAARAVTGRDDAAPAFGIVFGLSAIAGHLFPVWLRFKGGKAVATSCGVMLALAPVEVGIAVAVWMIVAGLTRYVSLASILAVVGLLAARFAVAPRPWERNDLPLSLLMLLVAALIIVRHRSNVRRLLAGTESKIGRKQSAVSDQQSAKDGHG